LQGTACSEFLYYRIIEEESSSRVASPATF
jgi:hypothetical protein